MGEKRHAGAAGAAVFNAASAAAADHPASALETKRLAVLRVQAGEFDAAISLFRRYLEDSPDDAGVLRTVGQLLAVQGDSSEAQNILGRALRIEPADAGSHELLANIHLAAGRHEEAIAGYRAAVAIDPLLSTAHSRLGAILYALALPGEARFHLEKALEIDDRDADAHNNLGNVLMSAGGTAEAVGSYEAAAAINPNWPLPHRNLGHALADLGRNEEAIAAYREALRLEPGDHEAAGALADAMVANGQTGEAIDVLKTVSGVLKARRRPEVANNMWPEFLEAGHTRSALDIVKLLEDKNGKLLTNFSVDSDSQFLAELDNFACMRALQEVPPGGFHVFLGPRTERTKAIAELYGDTICSSYILTDYAPEMARSIALFRPDLTVDVGISSAKRVPTEGRGASPVGAPDGHITYVTDRAAQEEDIANYYRRKRDLAGAVPLARRFDVPVELDNLIDLRGRRLALVCHEGLREGCHGKAELAETSRPETFIPALEYLRDNGFQIVHVGRQSCPSCYRHLDVVDYAGSTRATFKNDLVLLSNAAFCLFVNMGLTAIAGAMGKPFVAANIWDLSHPPVSGSCTYTLARAKDRKTGELTTFNKQLDVQASRGVDFFDSHEPVNSDADDILAATEEAMDEARELNDSAPSLSESQRNYRALTSKYPCSDMALSRISAAFIEHYRDLL